MATNFDIAVHEVSDGYRLKLIGEFDATSAYELIYKIKKLADKPMRLYVHTSELKKIHPFGLEVFNKAMRFSGSNSAQIVFEGLMNSIFADFQHEQNTLTRQIKS